jgi:structure-specific recognition protein 1
MPAAIKKSPTKEKKEKKEKKYIVKPKIPKDPKAPKGALTAFMIYSTEMRPKLPENIGFGESGKRLGEQWRGLKADKRANYEKKAEEDKLRYQDQMSKYKPSAKMAKDIADAKAKAPKIKSVSDPDD